MKQSEQRNDHVPSQDDALSNADVVNAVSAFDNASTAAQTHLFKLARHASQFPEAQLPAMVKSLLDGGDDINAISYSDNNDHLGTALHEAARQGHVPMIRCLLQLGADADASTGKALDDEKLAQELGTDGFDETPLFLACYHNHTEAAKVLLTERQNPFAGSCLVSECDETEKKALLRTTMPFQAAIAHTNDDILLTMLKQTKGLIFFCEVNIDAACTYKTVKNQHFFQSIHAHFQRCQHPEIFQWILGEESCEWNEWFKDSFIEYDSVWETFPAAIRQAPKLSPYIQCC